MATQTIDEEIETTKWAIEQYRQRRRLEDGNGPWIDLWHLIAGIVTLCDASNPKIDFDDLLADVRAELAASSPRSR